MRPNDLPAFAKILARHRVGFILVGGAAVERFIPSSSRDVDALVLPREYARAVRELDHDPEVVSISKEPGSLVSGHFIASGSLIRFDLLEPNAYSGDRTGEEFYQYVGHYRAVEQEGLTIAKPPVVWYMRLTIDDWRTYVPKILQDLQSGGDLRWLDEALDVANRFGRGPAVAERVAEVRAAGKVLGIGVPQTEERGSQRT